MFISNSVSVTVPLVSVTVGCEVVLESEEAGEAHWEGTRWGVSACSPAGQYRAIRTGVTIFNVYSRSHVAL